MIEWYRAGLDAERELPKLATYLGHAHVADTYWYVEAVPELLQLATERLVATQEGKRMIAPSLPALLQAFFTDRLLRQRAASPHTIAGYRDAFRLLVHFAAQRLRKSPSALQIEDLDAPFVGAFLEHLEQARGNGARTRNARLAAIHSFFRYVALREPAYALDLDRTA